MSCLVPVDRAVVTFEDDREPVRILDRRPDQPTVVLV